MKKNLLYGLVKLLKENKSYATELYSFNMHEYSFQNYVLRHVASEIACIDQLLTNVFTAEYITLDELQRCRIAMVSISSLVNRLIIDGVIQPVNLPDPCVMNLPPCELQPDDAFIHNPALNPDPSFVVQDNAPSSFNIEAPSPGILTDTFYGMENQTEDRNEYNR
ncbi:hypothetical protein Avbf_02090 [Armadillidium vulgare]|nr:hypothetical protein Avbf_02090 [Armadillidium vulgare]